MRGSRGDAQTRRENQPPRRGGWCPNLGGNPLESPTGPWQAPETLWSLWDMMEYVGFPLGGLLVELQRLGEQIGPARPFNMAGPGTVQLLQALLRATENECKKLGLKGSAILADEILAKLTLSGFPAIIAGELRSLQAVVQGEMHQHLFLYVPEVDAKDYKDPLATFSKTADRFKSARDDIIAASRCYAIGQASACVFHCMGILQPGLYALARRLDVVSETKPLELENWKNIIDRIAKAIGKLEEQGTNTKETDERLQFFSEAALQFRYFKDAWRNHVCHMRHAYDQDQARSVLQHVRSFMEEISSQLTEIPIPDE